MEKYLSRDFSLPEGVNYTYLVAFALVSPCVAETAGAGIKGSVGPG